MGKRTRVSRLPSPEAGGLGVIAMNVTPRTGDIVVARRRRGDGRTDFRFRERIVMRTKVEAIRAIGRATQGVMVMRIDEGDRVASFARVPQRARTKTAS